MVRFSYIVTDVNNIFDVFLTEESVYTEEIMFHHVHNAINAHRRSSRLNILVQNEYCRYRTKIVGHENEWVMTGFLGYWVPNSSDPRCRIFSDSSLIPCSATGKISLRPQPRIPTPWCHKLRIKSLLKIP